MPLFIVPTPIGNLGDITIRACEVLRSVDVIVAEDTRYTLKLLNHLGIKKKLLSLPSAREKKLAPEYMHTLKNNTVALVTDNGTPGISDPGQALIQQAIANHIPVTPLPGPTAFVPALVASGLASDRFLFIGFTPRTRGDQLRVLKPLAPLPYTIIFYESPRRIQMLLGLLAETFGNRPFAIAKELSKKNEAIIRGRLADWQAICAANILKGELVVLTAGHEGKPAVPDDQPALNTLEDLFTFFKQRHNISRNQIKKILMTRK